MDYLPIRTNTLRGDQKISFDVYIKIDQKMILYLRQGENFVGERLTRLRSKNLKKMFILKDKENSYRDYIETNLNMAFDDKAGKDMSIRTQIIHGQQQSQIEEIFDHPQDESLYQTAKNQAEKFTQFLSKHELLAIIPMLRTENPDHSVAHHGVNTATLSLALAQKLKIGDPKLHSHLVLGALLHDIGHADLKFSVNKSPQDFTAEESILYKKHPLSGATKIQHYKHFDTLVTRIILQHEECINGGGFPDHLREGQLDPLVIAVASANALDRMIQFEGIPPAQASQKLMLEKLGKHPLLHIQTLGQILKDL